MPSVSGLGFRVVGRVLVVLGGLEALEGFGSWGSRHPAFRQHAQGFGAEHYGVESRELLVQGMKVGHKVQGFRACSAVMTPKPTSHCCVRKSPS